MLSQFLPALHCLPSTALGQCLLNDLVNKQALEGPMFKPGEVSTDVGWRCIFRPQPFPVPFKKARLPTLNS